VRSGFVGAVLSLLVAAHAGSTAAESTQRTESLLAPISAKRLAHCERSALLRPVCPRSVPRVDFYLSHLSVGLTGIGGPVLDVFNLESGGEYPGRPQLNRPPSMAHVVVVAGNVERLAPLRVPGARSGEPVRDGVLRRKREAPVSFGRVRWASRTGSLYLAPGFPTGGMLGNHLNFTWDERRMQYTLSLHAWEPLTEAAAALRTMVERLPARPQADRLALLSPSRRLTMTAGPRTARARITAPAGRNAFHAYVVVPGRADVGVRIETGSGSRLRLLDSTTRFGRCGVRPPLRLCYIRVPRDSAPAGGPWTLVVTKQSQKPAVVRVDLTFRTR
jgi:hypothetical protein